MQKWEYHWVVIPGSLNEVKVGGEKIQSYDFVNQLGAEGWELVPDELPQNTDELKPYLDVSYEYIKTLKPKATKKKS